MKMDDCPDDKSEVNTRLSSSLRTALQMYIQQSVLGGDGVLVNIQASE